MTPTDLDYLSALIRERSGIVITRDKAYLLENRLNPIASRRGCDGLGGLVAQLRTGRDPALVAEVVEAMTTNETLFFRDSKPFDMLRADILPALLASRAAGRTLRIWSAACSTGQEPYSIAMLLKEEGPKLAGWRVEIVATDLCTAVLAKAKSGLYTQFEVQRGLPIRLMMKYFKQVGTQWEIDPTLRAMVDFRAHNIISDPPPLRGCDVVFCRNLLIYFEPDLKRRVLERLASTMAPDGVLFLGGTESVLGVTDRLEPLPGQRGAYRVAGGVELRQAAGGRG